MEASQAFVNSETQGGVCMQGDLNLRCLDTQLTKEQLQRKPETNPPRTTQNTRWYWQATSTEDQKNDPKKTLSGEVSKCLKDIGTLWY